MSDSQEPPESDVRSRPPTAYETRASIFNRLKSTGSRDREMAWSEFRSRYAPVIAGFAKRCGASNQDIDDIVQDVITGFFSVSGDFVYDPAKGRFRGWLKTCTVRAAVRRAGKNLHFRGMRLDEIPQVELAVEPMWVDVWEQQLVARALHELRREADDSLAFRAFEQYVLLDRPAEVVARELSTTVGNIHQAKSRMTRRLRELVGHIREDEETDG
jgi:RNA polymerase sigma-70 factor (ECF subfamily)